jgi:hypothetical protein
MIYTILSKLFSNEMQGEYYAKPIHLFYSVLFMATGTISFFYDGWVIFGVSVFTLALLLGLSIVFCMNWQKIIDYWTVINEHVILMNKSTNPDLWYALGYNKPPNKIQVIEQEDNGQGFTTTHITDVLVSPAKMNQVANKVLGSGKLDFTEEVYGSLIPNFRQFRKDWISKGRLVQKNKKNKKSGYVLSRKGLQVMYEYASDNIKLKDNSNG